MKKVQKDRTSGAVIPCIRTLAANTHITILMYHDHGSVDGEQIVQLGITLPHSQHPSLPTEFVLRRQERLES